MLDFIVDLVGQGILAVVGGTIQLLEDHLLAKKTLERTTSVKRRRQLGRKRQDRYGREGQHFSYKMRKARRE